jgi:hypothetical protein
MNFTLRTFGNTGWRGFGLGTAGGFLLGRGVQNSPQAVVVWAGRVWSDTQFCRLARGRVGFRGMSSLTLMPRRSSVLHQASSKDYVPRVGLGGGSPRSYSAPGCRAIHAVLAFAIQWVLAPVALSIGQNAWAVELSDEPKLPSSRSSFATSAETCAPLRAVPPDSATWVPFPRVLEPFSAAGASSATLVLPTAISSERLSRSRWLGATGGWLLGCPTPLSPLLSVFCCSIWRCRAWRAVSEGGSAPCSRHQRHTRSGWGNPAGRSPARHQEGSASSTRSRPPPSWVDTVEWWTGALIFAGRVVPQSKNFQLTCSNSPEIHRRFIAVCFHEGVSGNGR